jgi:hypothetical protein
LLNILVLSAFVHANQTYFSFVTAGFCLLDFRYTKMSVDHSAYERNNAYTCCRLLDRERSILSGIYIFSDALSDSVVNLLFDH